MISLFLTRELRPGSVKHAFNSRVPAVVGWYRDASPQAESAKPPSCLRMGHDDLCHPRHRLCRTTRTKVLGFAAPSDLSGLHFDLVLPREYQTASQAMEREQR